MRILRRRALAALAAAIGAAACVHDVHRIEPIGVPSPARTPAVRILVFGDFGLETIPQRLVARGIRRAHAKRPFDLAVQLGDNLYFCGPDPTRPGADTCRFSDDGATVAPGAAPPDDPVFRVNEDPLAGLRGKDGAHIPMYLALGNHDIGWGARCTSGGLTEEEATRRRACLSVARRTPAWTMPARHYVVDRGPVRLVVLDTNVVVADYGGFTLDEEVAFLREALEGCDGGRACFVFGHHPPAAAHGYGRPGRRSSPYAARMARLVAATEGRVRAFFGGHVHALGHLSLDGIDVFVSGSTAMGGFMPFTVRVPARAQLRFATSEWGYTVLEADGRGWRVEFRAHDGAPLHCCEAEGGGACRPVHCPS